MTENTTPETVYPRVGGGTLQGLFTRWLGSGLSPRGRGNLPDIRHLSLYPRSIPAWAGEPVQDFSMISLQEVYPRVGGGTCRPTLNALDDTGLSPRGRGNR